jgi:predicted ATPase
VLHVPQAQLGQHSGEWRHHIALLRHVWRNKRVLRLLPRISRGVHLMDEAVSALSSVPQAEWLLAQMQLLRDAEAQLRVVDSSFMHPLQSQGALKTWLC